MSWIKGLGITSMKRVNSFIVVGYPSVTFHGLRESPCVKTCQPPVSLATRGGNRRHPVHTHEHQILWEISTVSLSGKVWCVSTSTDAKWSRSVGFWKELMVHRPLSLNGDTQIYYLHIVCQSCNNQIQDIVYQVQWIWAIHGVVFIWTDV